MVLSKKGGNGFGSPVPSRQARPPTRDHHIHAGICDPTAEFSSDDVAVIGAEAAFSKEMTRPLQLLLEQISTGIIREVSAVGDG